MSRLKSRNSVQYRIVKLRKEVASLLVKLVPVIHTAMRSKPPKNRDFLLPTCSRATPPLVHSPPATIRLPLCLEFPVGKPAFDVNAGTICEVVTWSIYIDDDTW